ncbi:TerB family tellurite resistance protein [Rasiella rasia]|uniref:TerB family tellurite resistance protein n=1 Tax=Rasiella rasia TaxID=2744027 RepID=A0A6G6GKA2_9FLAO|nr:TerB family tellurite resistance protein [Rasiella rasia]QIE58947.1 TerB family tellurite resistance protein [Rasiella rasia]
MNKEQKSLISDLILIAKADDKITHGEYDFIQRIAERIGVTPKEVDELFHDPLPTKATFTELERITHFHRMVLLMNVDGETHEKEVQLLREFGLELGLRPGAVDQILVAMERYEHKIIPSQELLQIFNTYYN